MLHAIKYAQITYQQMLLHRERKHDMSVLMLGRHSVQHSSFIVEIENQCMHISIFISKCIKVSCDFIQGVPF